MRLVVATALLLACSEPPDPPPDAGTADAGTPFVEPEARVVTGEVRAVVLSDDDGARAATATEIEVGRWLDEVNRIYAPFDMRLELGLVERRRSTAINRTYEGDPMWPEAKRQGEAIAAEQPDVITVLVRHGPDVAPTALGFAWSDYRFIVMPDYAAGTVCGRTNVEQLARELGHHLGLYPTYALELDSEADALAAFAGDPSVFDGDGLDGTPPDPYVATSTIQCGGPAALTLGAASFPLPRDNVMSAYGDPSKRLTADQAAILRQGLALRTGKTAAALVDGRPILLEGEDLPAAGTDGATFEQDMRPFHGFWSGASQLFWADAGPDQRLDVRFSVAEAGAYFVFIGATRAADYGVHQHFVNGDRIGPRIDLYARSVQPTGPIPLGAAELTAGENVLTVAAVDENPAALPRRIYGLDYLLLVKGP